jgi:hypothetical protein
MIRNLFYFTRSRFLHLSTFVLLQFLELPISTTNDYGGGLIILTIFFSLLAAYCITYVVILFLFKDSEGSSRRSPVTLTIACMLIRTIDIPEQTTHKFLGNSRVCTVTRLPVLYS